MYKKVHKKYILEPPEGCQEIEGVIVVIVPGKKWMTFDGFETDNFNNRGIWDTEINAQEAIDKFCI